MLGIFGRRIGSGQHRQRPAIPRLVFAPSRMRQFNEADKWSSQTAVRWSACLHLATDQSVVCLRLLRKRGKLAKILQIKAEHFSEPTRSTRGEPYYGDCRGG
jgi:hypothetical protein